MLTKGIADTRVMKLSIIIPAFNEAETIEAVVERIRAVDLGNISKEIVVVDDASDDDMPRILDRLTGIQVIRHSVNSGKGAALSTGIRAATGEVVIFQDADLEYAPEDYPAVIEPILNGVCDVVMGSRFLRERPVFWGQHKSPYLNHYIGNLLIQHVTNILYGRRFTDYEGCYKAFLRSHLLDTPIEATGFEFDNELICKLLRKHMRIREVPIRYNPRTYSQGKKITWRHGLIILWTIVKWRFHPLEVTGPAPIGTRRYRSDPSS
ncbi:Dolichyl-phosphate mannose synthase related protein [Nitrospira japonica]|uniref:Dolichyl-phosphate mannose synthase related protein n=1 Tax=Nitrospira japonica TaxID=1325564 RepID=A0A1W1IB68_9BACT|nr:glycosyltransferase family 2 protein [Nitrospira japonica]SLM50264.1 Dolichyl-phosphate mannose synthase related protein [Nitrospira japonica]